MALMMIVLTSTNKKKNGLVIDSCDYLYTVLLNVLLSRKKYRCSHPHPLTGREGFHDLRGRTVVEAV